MAIEDGSREILEELQVEWKSWFLLGIDEVTLPKAMIKKTKRKGKLTNCIYVRMKSQGLLKTRLRED